jgi:hypothetical protein
MEGETMGIFGWSYPPGCSGTPADEPCVCEVCTLVDDCCCPECPECGVQGDPKCYAEGGHGLTYTDEQRGHRAAHDAMEAARREGEW